MGVSLDRARKGEHRRHSIGSGKLTTSEKNSITLYSTMKSHTFNKVDGGVVEGNLTLSIKSIGVSLYRARTGEHRGHSIVSGKLTTTE